MDNYLSLLKSLIQEVNDWYELKKKFDDLIESDQYSSSYIGKVFEYFCKYYFNTDPTIKDDFKNVWLFKEIPDDIKLKLNFTKQDYGVDILILDSEDKFLAIQCKYRINENSKLNWTKDKIANLFAYGNRADYFAIISNTSDLDQVSKSRVKNFTFYNIDHFLSIDTSTIKSILNKINEIDTPRKVKKPLQHQLLAINSTVNHFQSNDRGQLILPCGTGKTLTSLWIKEKLKSTNTLVLVPSLALLRQFKNEWAKNKNEKYKYILVCSERDIDKNADSPITHTYEMSGRVVDSEETIKDFLCCSGSKVVFSTYQSLKKIESALRNLNFTFDLIICDEAHRTAGLKHRGIFTLIHDNSRIPGQKRLYMTATPKIISKSVKTKLSDFQEFLYDMSDQEIFGSEAYRMSFKEAIEQNILVDYKIIAIGVNNLEIKDKIDEERVVDYKKTLQNSANVYALNKVMNEYGASHSITFHSRVKYAKEYSELFKEEYPGTYSDYISGQQKTSERAIKINEFKLSNNAVLSNSRCLNEGVDVPTIDLIHFCDPKNSKIDIVQACGRALRKDKHGKKNLGYVVVPIYHTQTEDVESAIDKSAFNNLIQVVRALSDNDERLYEEISSLFLKKEKSRESEFIDINIDNMENVLIIRNFEEKLKNSLFDEIIDKTIGGWQKNFNYLKLYRQVHPNKWPKIDEEFPNKNNLGIWLSMQKNFYNFGKLSQERINKLESIGFNWPDLLAEAWNENYKLLLEYRNNNPHKWPSQRSVEPVEHKLAVWFLELRKYYKLGNLEKEKIKKLENIGFPFYPQRYNWEKRFDEIFGFVRTYNRLPKQNIKNKKESNLNFTLTKYVEKLKNNELEDWQIEKLKKLDLDRFENQREEGWDEWYELVKKFKAEYGRLPTLDSRNKTKSKEENQLASWLAAQRKDYRRSELPGSRYEKLKELGVVIDTKKDFNQRWENNFNQVKKFLSENDEYWPRFTAVDKKERRLGRWLHNNKAWRNGKLKKYSPYPKEREIKLNSIGFPWSLDGKKPQRTLREKNKELWEKNYKDLINFRNIHPERWPYSNSDNSIEAKLAWWCNNNKAWRNRKLKKHGPYPKEREIKLNSIGFPWSYSKKTGTKNTGTKKWHKNYSELKSHLLKNEYKLPTYSENERLRTWYYRQIILLDKNTLSEKKAVLLNELKSSIW